MLTNRLCVLCFNRPPNFFYNWTQIPSEIAVSCNTYLSFEIVQPVTWRNVFTDGLIFCENCCENTTKLSKLHIQLQSIQNDINQLSSYINQDVLAQRADYQNKKEIEQNLTLVAEAVNLDNPTNTFLTTADSRNEILSSSADSNLDLDKDFGEGDYTEDLPIEEEPPKSHSKQNKSPYKSGLLKKSGLKCSKCSRIFVRATILASHDCDKATYDCETCGLSFSAPSVLKSHKSRVHGGGEKPFKCNDCGKSFGFKHHLIPHMRLHTGEKPFECNICGKKFIAQKVLVEHKRRRHDKAAYSCEMCYKRFDKLEIFEIHLRIHLKKGCETCDNHSSITMQDLSKHLKTHGRPKRHACEQCGKAFETKRSLDIHITSHVKGKHLQCDQCGKRFKCHPALKYHVESEHSKPETLVCEVCGRTCHHLLQYKQHLRTHPNFPNNEKELNCKLCGKPFKYQKSLESHMASFHGGERPHKCDQCKKAFVSKESLKIHKKGHLDISERYLINCTICKHSFKTNNLLREHQIISHEVTAGFPVVCEHCNSQFYHLGNYQHKLQRTKVNQHLACSICDDSGERFTKCCDLLTHLKDYHPEVEKNIYKCKRCKFTMSPWFLRNHDCMNLKVVKLRGPRRFSRKGESNEIRMKTRSLQMKNGCTKQLRIKLTRIDSETLKKSKKNSSKINKHEDVCGREGVRLPVKEEHDTFCDEFDDIDVKMEFD